MIKNLLNATKNKPYSPDGTFTKEFISKATHPHPCPLPSRERGLKNRPSLEGRG